MMFVAFSYSARLGSDLRVDALIGMLPQGCRNIIEIINLILCIMVAGFLFYHSFGTVAGVMETGEASVALKLPMQYVYAASVVGYGLGTVRYIQRLVLFILGACGTGLANLIGYGVSFTDSIPGLLVLIVLMFVGASPGSTGGGIKTTTFFTLMQGIKSAATNRSEKAFHYALPRDSFRKAAVITLLALGVVVTGTYLMTVFEPQLELRDILFEVVSAFGTVGLSTGITGGLSVPSKLLSILIMYTGRLGPLTIATLWHFTRGERTRYIEGNISIG